MTLNDHEVSIPCRVLTSSHNAPTRAVAGRKAPRCQRLSSSADRILVPQPATNIDVSCKTRLFLTPREKSGNVGAERARVRTQHRHNRHYIDVFHAARGPSEARNG